MSSFCLGAKELSDRILEMLVKVYGPREPLPIAQ